MTANTANIIPCLTPTLVVSAPRLRGPRTYPSCLTYTARDVATSTEIKFRVRTLRAAEARVQAWQKRLHPPLNDHSFETLVELTRKGELVKKVVTTIEAYALVKA